MSGVLYAEITLAHHKLMKIKDILNNVLTDKKLILSDSVFSDGIQYDEEEGIWYITLKLITESQPDIIIEELEEVLLNKAHILCVLCEYNKNICDVDCEYNKNISDVNVVAILTYINGICERTLLTKSS